MVNTKTPDAKLEEYKKMLVQATGFTTQNDQNYFKTTARIIDKNLGIQPRTFIKDKDSQQTWNSFSTGAQKARTCKLMESTSKYLCSREKWIDFLIYFRAWNLAQSSNYLDKISTINQMLTDLGHSPLYILSIDDFAVITTIRFDLSYQEYCDFLGQINQEIANDTSESSLKISDNTFTNYLEYDWDTKVKFLGTPEDSPYTEEDRKISVWQFFNLYKKEFGRIRTARFYTLVSILKNESITTILSALNGRYVPLISMSEKDLDNVVALLCQKNAQLLISYKLEKTKQNSVQQFKDYFKNMSQEFLLWVLLVYLSKDQVTEAFNNQEEISKIICGSNQKNVFFRVVNNILEKCGYKPVDFREAQNHPVTDLKRVLSETLEYCYVELTHSNINLPMYPFRPFQIANDRKPEAKKQETIKNVILKFIDDEQETLAL